MKRLWATLCVAVLLAFTQAYPEHQPMEYRKSACFINIPLSGSGSGVYYRGFVVTAGHCAEGVSPDHTVIVADWEVNFRYGHFIQPVHPKHDVALVRLTNPYDAPEVQFAAPVVGETVYAYGHMSLSSNVITVGTITNVSEFECEFTNFCYYGFSGGPLFNERGEVVAIMVRMTVGQEDINGFGVRGDLIDSIIDDILRVELVTNAREEFKRAHQPVWRGGASW